MPVDQWALPARSTVARGNQGVRLPPTRPQVAEPSALPVDQLGPAAALGDPAVVEDQDLVDGGALEGAWCSAGSSMIRTGKTASSAHAGGCRCRCPPERRAVVLAHHRVEPGGQAVDPVQETSPVECAPQVALLGVGAGETQVLPQ